MRVYIQCGFIIEATVLQHCVSRLQIEFWLSHSPSWLLCLLRSAARQRRLAFAPARPLLGMILRMYDNVFRVQGCCTYYSSCTLHGVACCKVYTGTHP